MSADFLNLSPRTAKAIASKASALATHTAIALQGGVVAVAQLSQETAVECGEEFTPAFLAETFEVYAELGSQEHAELVAIWEAASSL